MRAHPCRAVLDALLQRACSPGVNVLNGKAGFYRGNARHGIGLAPVLRCTPIDDTGLVEMDMGFDQARTDDAAVRIECLGIRGQVRFDCDDPAGIDADIDQGTFRYTRQTGVANYQVHVPSLSERS